MGQGNRNAIAAEEIDVSQALPHHKYELFAQEMARGKTQGQAYLAAGYRCQERLAKANAGKLLTRKPYIRDRVEHILGRRMNHHILEVNDLVSDDTIVHGIMEVIDKAAKGHPILRVKDGVAKQVVDESGEPAYDGKASFKDVLAGLKLLAELKGMVVKQSHQTKQVVKHQQSDAELLESAKQALGELPDEARFAVLGEGMKVIDVDDLRADSATEGEA